MKFQLYSRFRKKEETVKDLVSNEKKKETVKVTLLLFFPDAERNKNPEDEDEDNDDGRKE